MCAASGLLTVMLPGVTVSRLLFIGISLLAGEVGAQAVKNNPDPININIGILIFSFLS
jgi:hypothetical protein